MNVRAALSAAVGFFRIDPVDAPRVFAGATGSLLLVRLLDATQVWLILNLVFSLASYGLNSYEWYLLGAFSVVMRRLVSASGSTKALGARGQ